MIEKLNNSLIVINILVALSLSIKGITYTYVFGVIAFYTALIQVVL